MATACRATSRAESIAALARSNGCLTSSPASILAHCLGCRQSMPAERRRGPIRFGSAQAARPASPPPAPHRPVPCTCAAAADRSTPSASLAIPAEHAGSSSIGRRGNGNLYDARSGGTAANAAARVSSCIASSPRASARATSCASSTSRRVGVSIETKYGLLPGVSAAPRWKLDTRHTRVRGEVTRSAGVVKIGTTAKKQTAASSCCTCGGAASSCWRRQSC